MNKIFNIAIDGPSGAGKSTIAKAVAKGMGIIYIDTGAIYRSVGLYVCRKGIESTDSEKIVPLLSEMNIEVVHDENKGQRMILNGEDVSEAIRVNEISKYASDVSKLPEVRAFLLDYQRSFARRESVVMDGRDIGTVVLPDAQLKIFLTASPEKRAYRRYLELSAKGDTTTCEELLKQMQERDKNDSERAIAPLKAADDAVVVDTSDLTLEESIDAVMTLAKKRSMEI